MRDVLHIFTVPGSLRFVRGLAPYLRTRGYRMSVATSGAPELEAFAAEEGVRAFAVSMPRSITPLQDLRAVAELVRAARVVRPAIIHAHTPKGGLLGMLAGSACWVPARIYHMRGLPLLTARGASRILMRVTETVSCSLATRVLCVSHSLRDIAVHERLVAARRIQVLMSGSGQGVDADVEFNPDQTPGDQVQRLRNELGFQQGTPVVLFAGRLVRDKGIIDLADAWGVVRAQVPDARLVLLGTYEPRDPVPPDVVERLRSDPSVRHVAWTDSPATYYAIASLLVLPTYREGFPNVPLEAAAMCRPVVATRVVGCIDAVEDGRTGTLVPPGDPSALADAVIAYLRDPNRAARHGEAGRARVLSRFRRADIWAAIADLYDELLPGQSPVARSPAVPGRQAVAPL